MDKQNNNRNDFLWTLLANPANDAHLYAADLQQLVNDYPQSGVLQALLAHASEEKNLKRASAYFSPHVLFKLINSPSGFAAVPEENIIIQTNVPANGYQHHLPVTENEGAYPEEENAAENYFNDHSVVEAEEHEYVGEQQFSAEHEAAQPVVDERHLIEPAEDKTPSENKISGLEGVMPSNALVGDGGAENEDVTEAVTHAGDIIQAGQSADEEETFDEITGIEDIHIKPAASGDSAFVLEKEFDGHQPTENKQKPATAEDITGKAPDVLAGDAGHSDVSRYHDEKMPYTFMWWLDKTRKDHSGIYQPYGKREAGNYANKAKTKADELQQQYYENIFHTTSVDELEKNTLHKFAAVNVKRKEQGIIERFIKEEPQIKPQSSDKLDNENKAKKSSEDADELITETLAAIYSDQMLYNKAIAAYQKLMLKFPEKSRYFADKIEQLEKKTN